MGGESNQCRQGDIFQTWHNEAFDLLVLFGHRGFNNLDSQLKFEAPLGDERLTLPYGWTDPEERQAKRFTDGRYWIAFSDRGSAPDGLSDEEVTACMGKAYRECQRLGLTKVLTNGVEGDKNRRPERVQLLSKLATEQAEIHTTFINSNDVFLRD